MQKRILVIGDSMSLAHVGRALTLANRLRKEGAEIIFATGCYHLDLAKQEGFETHEIFCVPPKVAYEAICRGTHIFDKETLRRYINSDLSIIKKVKPDLIIGDMRLSLNISAELTGVEYWSILSGYLTHYYSAPQKPPQTFPAVRLLGKNISNTIFPLMKAFTIRHFASSFRQIRKELNLKPVNNIFDVIASPYRNLIADLPQFIPCTNLPFNFEYIGPLLWEPKVSDPEWLDKLDPHMPTAYISMGSTGNLKNLHRLIKIMSQKGWQILTTTAGLTSISSQVFAADFARGSELLKRSQLLVCHGGSGTIYQAASEGVPVIGIATFHDQEINLDRVEALSWGCALDPLKWKEKDLLLAIEKVQLPKYKNAIASAKKEISSFILESNRNPILLYQNEKNRGAKKLIS